MLSPHSWIIVQFAGTFVQLCWTFVQVAGTFVPASGTLVPVVWTFVQLIGTLVQLIWTFVQLSWKSVPITGTNVQKTAHECAFNIPFCPFNTFDREFLSKWMTYCVIHYQQMKMKAATDAAIGTEWRFHDLMINVKQQVRAQYGMDSDQVQSVGLKKRSKKSAPSKSDAPAPAIEPDQA